MTLPKRQFASESDNMPLVARVVLKLLDNKSFLHFSFGAGLAYIALRFAAAQVFCLSFQLAFPDLSLPDTPCDCGTWAYTFRFGIHFCPCGCDSCNKQTYFLCSKSCAFWCVQSTFLRGHSVCHWSLPGASYEKNSWLSISWGRLKKRWWFIWYPFSAHPKVQWICISCICSWGQPYSEMYWAWRGPWSIHSSTVSHLKESICIRSWRAHKKRVFICCIS